MSKRQKQYQHAIELVRQCQPGVILRAASRCDGHTIFKPEAFTEAGLPAEVTGLFTRKYKSDGSPKGTIFVNGQPVKELTGVYGLDLLRFIASALDVEYRQAIGRGFEAQNIQTALRQHLTPLIKSAATAERPSTTP
jgi:hypothetical protein